MILNLVIGSFIDVFYYILQVYFGKTREMVCTLRPPAEVAQLRMPES
jgi:hypothetical protein